MTKRDKAQATNHKHPGNGAHTEARMTYGGLHAYHVSRLLSMKNIPFAALLFECIRRADSHNYARLKMAFPEIVEEMRRRYNAPLGVLMEDAIETDMEALAEQIGRLSL